MIYRAARIVCEDRAETWVYKLPVFPWSSAGTRRFRRQMLPCDEAFVAQEIGVSIGVGEFIREQKSEK
jgi:hypothetical protein